MSGPSAAAPTTAVGVVIAQRLVLPGPGRASGTFTASGALSGVGTVVIDDALTLTECEPVVVDTTERLTAPGGSLGITFRASLRPVPGASMLTGGGTWNVTDGDGRFAGLRAAGTLTGTVDLDGEGGATLDLVLTGRLPQ